MSPNTLFWIAACLPRWRGECPVEIAQLCEVELSVDEYSTALPEDLVLSEEEVLCWIRSVVSALVCSREPRLSTEDVAEQYLLEWVQERFSAHRLFVREWTLEAPGSGEPLSETLSLNLTLGLFAGVAELRGVGWRAALHGCEAELRVDGAPDVLVLKPHWVLVAEDKNDDITCASRTFTTRAPASDELAVWELEFVISLTGSCDSGTATAALDGRYTCLLEEVLDEWKLGAYREAYREMVVGDEVWMLWLSVTQPWQFVRSSVPSRSFLLRRMILPTGNMSVRDVCRDFVGIANGNSLLVDRCGSPLAREVEELLQQLETNETVFLGAQWPTVSAVRAVVGLPFVDPRRFVVLDENDGDGGNDIFGDEGHDICIGGQWLPLSPLNEWLLRRGENELLLDGRWHLVNFSTVTLTNYGQFGESGPLPGVVDVSNVAWLKRRNDPLPLRFVCAGVPMSLETRVLRDSCAPLVFQNPNVVVMSPTGPPPLAVLRAWNLGDRTNPHVNEYFGLGKRFAGRMLSRGTERRAERASEDHRRVTTEPRALLASKYQYRFPVDLNGDDR